MNISKNEYRQYIKNTAYDQFYIDGKLHVDFEKWNLIRIYSFHMHKWYNNNPFLHSETPYTICIKLDLTLNNDALSIPSEIDLRISQDELAGKISLRLASEKISQIESTYKWPLIKNKNRKMFVRLSPCSPKDVAHLSCFCTSYKEALTLIFASKRCQTYINNYFEPLYLCLREPINTDINRELRCFIYNKRLTAISSSSDGILPTDITLEQVQNKVIPFFKRIKKNIPFKECIMDITILQDEERVILLEFNTWKILNSDAYENKYVSGTYLFDWDLDYDILTGKIRNLKYPVIRL